MFCGKGESGLWALSEYFQFYYTILWIRIEQYSTIYLNILKT